MAGGPNVSSSDCGAAGEDLTQLVRQHHQVLYAYAYRLTGSAADAEDLTQQTFLVAQQKLDQLRDRTKARSWLMKVLRNGFLKSRRHPRPVPAVDVNCDVEAVVDEVDSEEPIDGELLQHAVEQLPEEFRTVVLMFYFEQLSYRQIAQELAVPAGTVMSRLSRAKTYLRQRLRQQEDGLSKVIAPTSRCDK